VSHAKQSPLRTMSEVHPSKAQLAEEIEFNAHTALRATENRPTAAL
jgi:hypothetical protein